ncbi:hypothetical protein NKH69_29165 [Mesorhizobium sp. M0976]
MTFWVIAVGGPSGGIPITKEIDKDRQGRIGVVLAPTGKIADLDWLAPDPQLATDGIRNAAGVSLVDQSDTEPISDKAQKDARTDVMFDNCGKLHAISNSVGEQKCFAPMHEQRLLAQFRPLDYGTAYERMIRSENNG